MIYVFYLSVYFFYNPLVLQLPESWRELALGAALPVSRGDNWGRDGSRQNHPNDCILSGTQTEQTHFQALQVRHLTSIVS